MKGCLGGTFDVIHEGHMSLFREAFRRFDELVVGVTSDAYAAEHKERRVKGYRERAKAVRAMLARESPIPFSVRRLDDAMGPALDPEMGGIVVSEETFAGADAINRRRCEIGLAPLDVFRVALMTAGGRKLSARSYGTDRAAEVVLDGPAEARDGVVSAFLHLHPRATVVQRPSKGRADRYSVALSSSTVEVDGQRFAVMTADVSGPKGFRSRGLSSGCLRPEGLSIPVEEGASLREAAARLEVDGSGSGEAGYLMSPFMTLSQLAEAAVLSALVPLMSPELFGKGAGSWPISKRRKKVERPKLYILKRKV